MEMFDIAGHTSYVLIAISYYLTNMIWLRIVAVIGLCFEVLYFQLSGGNMGTGIAWDFIFIAINGYQLYWLYDQHRAAAALEGGHHLRSGAFAGLTPFQTARLIHAGHWMSLDAGEEVTREGEPVKALYYLADGEFDVVKQGEIVASLRRGAFIGEMAFLSGAQASATVVAREQARLFVFDADRLHKIAEKDENVAAAIHMVLGRDLATKLRSMKTIRPDTGWGYAGPE